MWSGGESVLQSGRTALMRAVINGHMDCMRLLIDAGANKDVRNSVRFDLLHFRCVSFSVLIE